MNVNWTQGGGNIMPLSTYQYINPSEFDKQGKPIYGHDQDRTIQKEYNGKSIQQHGIRICCKSTMSHSAWNEQNEKNRALHKAPKGLNRDS